MENTLKKYLSKAEVFALSFGCAIGWGVFMMPGSNFLPSGGPLGTIIGVLIGALVMIIIGRNYHILMQKTNDNGGAYSYAKNVFGIDHGFLVGWFIILIYIAILWANSSAFVLLMRYTVGNVFQFGFHYTIAGYDIWFGEMLLSTTITVGICLLCAFKKKIASITQVVFASILIIGILITCIWVFVGNSRGAAAFTPAFSDQGPSVLQIFSIVVLNE
jgi:amino acid transporter